MWNHEILPRINKSSASAQGVLRMVSLVESCPGSEGSPLDFAKMAFRLKKLCIPMYNHQLSMAAIFSIAEGESVVVATPNPLANSGLPVDDFRAVFNAGTSRHLALESEVTSGPFIISPLSSSWLWVGFYSDYGFFFSDIAKVEKVLCKNFLTAYAEKTMEFRRHIVDSVEVDEMTQRLDAFAMGFLQSR